MTDYRVQLDIFSGPLDLLLYLIRKEEVDIYDIPITRITEQYINYIEMLKMLDIDLAGSFLVMAATLMQIKSAMLLPQAEPDELDEGDLSDPRAELIRQLLEYKKFKDAANLLGDAAEQAQNRFARPGTIIENLKPTPEPEMDMEQVSVWDLLEAFDAICKATGTNFRIDHITDETPIDLYQIEILARLQSKGPLEFTKIFDSCTNRLVMVGLFLALLELVRDGLVSAEQSPKGSTLLLKALTEEPPEQAVQRTLSETRESAEAGRREQAVGAKGPEEPAGPPIPIAELPVEKKRAAADYEAVGLQGDDKKGEN